MIEPDAFVLVHGAHHGSWAWDDLRPLLALPVLAADLPARAAPTRTPVSVAACADRIFAAIDQAGIRHAVVVGHSLGGTIAYTIAAEHPDRVVHLIGVAAVFPPPGLCALDLYPRGLRWLPKTRLKLRPGGRDAPLKLSTGKARRSLCNDLDARTTASLVDRLVPEMPTLVTTPVSAQTLPAHVARSYILCRNDRSLTAARQRTQAANIDASIVELASGHEPMLHDPVELASALNTLACEQATPTRPARQKSPPEPSQ